MEACTQVLFEHPAAAALGCVRPMASPVAAASSRLDDPDNADACAAGSGLPPCVSPTRVSAAAPQGATSPPGPVGFASAVGRLRGGRDPLAPLAPPTTPLPSPVTASAVKKPPPPPVGPCPPPPPPAVDFRATSSGAPPSSPSSVHRGDACDGGQEHATRATGDSDSVDVDATRAAFRGWSAAARAAPPSPRRDTSPSASPTPGDESIAPSLPESPNAGDGPITDSATDSLVFVAEKTILARQGNSVKGVMDLGKAAAAALFGGDAALPTCRGAASALPVTLTTGDGESLVCTLARQSDRYGLHTLIGYIRAEGLRAGDCLLFWVTPGGAAIVTHRRKGEDGGAGRATAAMVVDAAHAPAHPLAPPVPPPQSSWEQPPSPPMEPACDDALRCDELYEPPLPPGARVITAVITPVDPTETLMLADAAGTPMRMTRATARGLMSTGLGLVSAVTQAPVASDPIDSGEGGDDGGSDKEGVGDDDDGGEGLMGAAAGGVGGGGDRRWRGEREAANAMGLPGGWLKRVRYRRSGRKNGATYYSPDGIHFRTLQSALTAAWGRGGGHRGSCGASVAATAEPLKRSHKRRVIEPLSAEGSDTAGVPGGALSDLERDLVEGLMQLAGDAKRVKGEGMC